MFEVGRDLWRSFSQTSQTKMGHLEQDAQDHGQTVNISSEGNSKYLFLELLLFYCYFIYTYTCMYMYA